MNRTQGLPIPVGRSLYPLTTELRETLGELGHFLGSYVARVMHTARFSNVQPGPQGFSLLRGGGKALGTKLSKFENVIGVIRNEDGKMS